jgi:serralysin
VAGVDANSSASGHQAFTFVGSASFSSKAGELRVYQEADGRYIVAGDVNGDGVADLLINIGSAQAGLGDFVFL